MMAGWPDSDNETDIYVFKPLPLMPLCLYAFMPFFSCQIVNDLKLAVILLTENVKQIKSK